MDTSVEPPLDYEPPPMPTGAELREMLDRRDADGGAGRTVPRPDVLAMTERRIAEMESRQRDRQA